MTTYPEADLAYDPSSMCVCMLACQTDQVVRWKAVNLYRVKLGCCVRMRIQSSHLCVSAGSDPGSDDPGVVGCQDNSDK